MFFADRKAAGEALADTLSGEDWTDFTVLGLIRGGVPVGKPIADRFGLPIKGVCLAPTPMHEPVADPKQAPWPSGLIVSLGFVCSMVIIGDEEDAAVHTMTIPVGQSRVPAYAYHKVLARSRYFNHGAPEIETPNVLVVDDGLVTGTQARYVVNSLRAKGHKQIHLAVPVVTQSGLRHVNQDITARLHYWRLSSLDGATPGMFYEDGGFYDTPDEEVLACLAA